MAKAKVAIGVGIVLVLVTSIGMTLISNPLNGIAVFFVFTCLLWAVAKTRHWI